MENREAVSSRPSSAGLSSEREGLDILEEISNLLQTGLLRHELKACMKLIQQGQSPEGVARVVQDLRAEASAAASSNAQEP